MTVYKDYIKYISPVRFIISFTAFLAAGLLAVLTKDTIDTPLIVFSCMSAIALPTLFVFILVDMAYQEIGKLVPGISDMMFMGVTMIIGLGSGFSAVVALFWHFSSTAAILFAVITPFLCWGTYRFFLIPYIPVLDSIVEAAKDSDSEESKDN
jgi:hypothetical protein